MKQTKEKPKSVCYVFPLQEVKPGTFYLTTEGYTWPVWISALMILNLVS